MYFSRPKKFAGVIFIWLANDLNQSTQEGSWIVLGKWVYYDGIYLPGQITEIDKAKYNIPAEETTNEFQGKEFNILLIVEALQDANVPDDPEDENHPWDPDQSWGIEDTSDPLGPGSNEPILGSESLTYEFTTLSASSYSWLEKDLSGYEVVGYENFQDNDDIIISTHYDDGENGEHEVIAIASDSDNNFNNSLTINSLEIPHTVRVIKLSAFEDIDINNLGLSYGLKEIGSRAFSSTYDWNNTQFSSPKISEVLIPHSVIEIGVNAFEFREIDYLEIGSVDIIGIGHLVIQA